MDIFDVSSKTMDMNNMKVPFLPFNPGVAMPGPLKHEEVHIHKFKDEVMEKVRQLKGKSEERGGLKSLKDRAHQGQVVCCVTDKSGRLACDTAENYKEACLEELWDNERTPVIDLKSIIGVRER